MNNKQNTKSTVVETIFGSIFLGIFLLISIGFLFSYDVITVGIVGKSLWSWFVVSTFHITELTFLQSFGIALLIRFWTHQNNSYKGKDERSSSVKIAEVIGLMISPWLILLFGWIIRHFIS